MNNKHNDNNNFWDIFNSWGPWFLSLFIPSGTVLAGIAFNWNTVLIISIGASLLFVLILLFVLLFNPIKARIRQWRYGKIKGLWVGKSLDKQIFKNFTSSKTIRIKVTRGTELVDENHSINIIDELEYLKKRADQQTPISIYILLMAPCYKLKHVNERYKTHEGEYESKQDFLNSWKDTIKKLSSFETEYFRISVRFYFGGHSRWRFYICSNRDDEKQIIMLSNYDKETSGSTTPMYKIIKGEKNIGAFMDKYFEDIWKTSIKIKDYNKYVFDQRCVRLFCEECQHTNINVGDYCKENCSAAKCDYYDNCVDRVKEWDNVYNNLSRLQRINMNLDLSNT